MMRSVTVLGLILLAGLVPVAAPGQETQRFADLGACPTAHGDTVLDCRIGYRAYGRLSTTRDNAVLVPTWHGGRSATMTWLLGPGRWADTSRYFVILMDALGNGVSTSPSNSRRQTGVRFPRLTIEDMVAAQHRVITDRHGIRRLHAVIGWSMGGMQALAWALNHPQSVDRVVSVAGTPRMGSYDVLWVRSMPMLLELAQRTGMTPDTLATRLTEVWHLVATTPAEENRTPRDGLAAVISAEARQDWLEFHPEDDRAQLESLVGFDTLTPAGKRPARRPGDPRILLVYVPEDHVTTPESFRELARLTGADTVAHWSACGHMAPVCDAAAIGGYVRRFLDAPPVRARGADPPPAAQRAVAAPAPGQARRRSSPA